MSSKYANLPDIDTAPDLYQTVSRPSTPTRDNDQEGDEGGNDDGVSNTAAQSSKYIDSDNISRKAAAERFGKATQLRANDTDFSGSLIARRPRAPPLPQHAPTHGFETDVYELAGASSSTDPTARIPETPLARLRRLQAETRQLEEELSESDAKGNEAETSEGMDTVQMLQQLRVMRTELSRLESQSPASTTEVHSWEGDAKKLLSELSASSTGPSDPSTTTSASGVEGKKATEKQPLVGFEERITELENLVGVRQAMIDVSDSSPLPRPLLTSLGKLEHQLTLLTQPRNLDAVSRRAKVVVAELESLRSAKAALASSSTTVAAKTEANANGGDDKAGSRPSLLSDPAALAQLSSLFALQPRLEALLPLAPTLVARLRSLASLHSSASSFSSSLATLSDHQAEGQRRVTEISQVLGAVKESFEGNVVLMKGNLDSVEERIEGLLKRMKALETGGRSP